MIKSLQTLKLFAVTFVYSACIFFVVAVVIGLALGVIHWAFPGLPVYHGLNLAHLILVLKVSTSVGGICALMSCAMFLFNIDPKEK